MENEFYKNVVDKLPIGYIYCKVLFDAKNNVCDYEYIDTNEFGRQYISDSLIGKKYSDFSKKDTKVSREWIKICGEVALSGVENEIANYKFSATKRLKVKIWSPKKNHFVLNFDDVTEETIKQKAMETLLIALNDLVFEVDSNYVFTNILTNDDSLLFVPRSQIIGHSINEFFDDIITKQIVDVINKAQLTNEKETITYHSVLPGDNKWYMADVKSTPSGDTTKTIISIRNITEQKAIEDSIVGYQEQLKNIKEEEALLFSLFSLFVNTKIDNSKKIVIESLNKMACLIKADRAYVYKYDFALGFANPLYEWSCQCLETELDSLKETSLDLINSSVKEHKKGNSIIIKDISQLDDIDLKERMNRQLIKSFLSVPLMNGHKCYGFVAFEYVSNYIDEKLEQNDLVLKYGQLLINLLLKTEHEKELNEIKIKLEAIL